MTHQENSALRPHFRLLYNNDVTNIMVCESPYHRRGEQVTANDLKESVADALNADVVLISPGTGWVAWWPSNIAAIDSNELWFSERYGVEPRHSFSEFFRDSGDLVQTMTEEIRGISALPFVSFRLNDSHHLEFADVTPEPWMSLFLSEFYERNPDLRRVPAKKDWSSRIHNWEVPRARQYKYDLIRELCENYSLAGLELDFMRHPSFFVNLGTDERKKIMTDFVRSVRTTLDATSDAGEHRWLCVRIPAVMDAYDSLGIDLESMVEAGVEMVNLSSDYFTMQQSDLRKVVQRVPSASVYVEMSHTTMTAPVSGQSYDSFDYRRTTDEQYYTTAHVAYARGAQGVSLFNFVYYRRHGIGDRGPFSQPPFHILQNLKNRKWLSEQPQHYFIATVWDFSWKRDRTLPRLFSSGDTASFDVDMAPPAGGWVQGGRLRIQTDSSLVNSHWTAQINGQNLVMTNNVSEPYSVRYPNLLGDEQHLIAWEVDPSVLHDGVNSITISLHRGNPTTIVFIDLAAQ